MTMMNRELQTSVERTAVALEAHPRALESPESLGPLAESLALRPRGDLAHRVASPGETLGERARRRSHASSREEQAPLKVSGNRAAVGGRA